MQLFYSPNSPYARKARVIIRAKALTAIEEISVMPSDNPPALWAINPLGTVPALRTADGTALCDSSVICEYLDQLPSPTPRLIPTDGPERIAVLNRASFAHGMMDAAVTVVMEGRRPTEKQWEATTRRKEAAIRRTIATLAETLPQHTAIDLGIINQVIALEYVAFRLPHLHWQTDHPALAEWLTAWSALPAFKSTQPQP